MEFIIPLSSPVVVWTPPTSPKVTHPSDEDPLSLVCSKLNLTLIADGLSSSASSTGTSPSETPRLPISFYTHDKRTDFSTRVYTSFEEALANNAHTFSKRSNPNMTVRVWDCRNMSGPLETLMTQDHSSISR